MVTYLLATAFIALTVPGLVLAVRALPPVLRWVEAGVKPWSCDVCLSFWASAALGIGAANAFGDWRYALCASPAYTVALGLLSHLERPTTPAPSLAPWAEAAPEHEERERGFEGDA